MQRLTTTLGMHLVKKTYHISSYVGRWPYVKMLFGDSTFENNQWGLGWTRYHRGLLWPKARAPA
eukprot:7398195-Pyramimonas_sp.AAC.1